MRTAWIRKTHNARNLIKGFSCRIIPCLSQKLECVVIFYNHQHRMTSGYDQRQERRLKVRVLQQVGKNMAFHMVHRNQRLIQSPGAGLGRCHTYQQRTYQPWPFRNGNGIDIIPCTIRFSEGFQRHRQHILYMMTRCDFRDYSPKFLMNGNLC